MSGCLGWLTPVAGWLRNRRLARKLDAAIAAGTITIPPGQSVWQWLRSPAGKAWASRQL